MHPSPLPQQTNDAGQPPEKPAHQHSGEPSPKRTQEPEHTVPLQHVQSIAEWQLSTLGNPQSLPS